MRRAYFKKSKCMVQEEKEITNGQNTEYIEMSLKSIGSDTDIPTKEPLVATTTK